MRGRGAACRESRTTSSTSSSDSKSRWSKPFIDDYLAGRTPIPCTLCNNFIKFDQFLDMAAGVGAEASPPGTTRASAAMTRQDAGRCGAASTTVRIRHTFCSGLTQEQMSRTLFPLGGYTKPEVRALAREMDIPVAEKSDSQEICFVPNGDYAAFIDAYFREQGIDPSQAHGEIVDC